LRLHRGALAALLLFLCLAVATLVSKGVLIERFFHDIYVPIDTMWRAASGQIPHLDYPTPIGQAYAWPFRLLASLGDVSALTVLHANLLMAGSFLGLSLIALLPRLSPLHFFLAAAAVTAMAMAPRDYDHFWYIYSHLASYNRWGSAAAALLAMIVLLPRMRGPKLAGTVTDGVVIGLLWALLFYLKVSFFAGALGIMVLGLVMGQLQLRTAGVALAVTALAVAAVELAYGNNGAYLADLAMAAAVNGEGAIARLMSLDLAQNAVVAAVFLVGGVLMVRALSGQGKLKPMVIGYRKELFLFVALIGAAIIIHSQNNYSREVPLLAVAMIILSELARRRIDEADGTREAAGSAARRTRTGLALLLVLGGTSTLLDSTSVVTHSASTHGSDAMQLPVLANTPGEPLMVSRQLMENFPPYRPELMPPGGEAFLPTGIFQRRARWQAHTALEVRSLTEAMELLRAQVRPGDVIFSVDFANPFPAFFRLPPPRGSLPWWHRWRSYSPASHPDLDRLFSSTTLVAQKRIDFYSGLFGAELWPLIEGKVRSLHAPVAEGSIWTVWRRNDTAAAGPSAAVAN
jgi:hypothetical protein